MDLSFRFQMKIISYHHKNHLLDDFQEVLKSVKKMRYFSDHLIKKRI